MNREDIFLRLNAIFSKVLGLDGVILEDNTCADDIEEWDSIAQIQLISLIQSEFNIKFSAKEMLSWDNVGQMIDTIHSKI